MKARLFRTANEVVLERQQQLDQPTEEHDTQAAANEPAPAPAPEAEVEVEHKARRRRSTDS